MKTKQNLKMRLTVLFIAACFLTTGARGSVPTRARTTLWLALRHRSVTIGRTSPSGGKKFYLLKKGSEGLELRKVVSKYKQNGQRFYDRAFSKVS
jgi:hypothetical protein